MNNNSNSNNLGETTNPISQSGRPQYSNFAHKNEFKVFVGNVPYNCYQDEFSNCFNHLHGYKHCEVIIRPGTTLSRGFGFVIFDDKKDADVLLNTDKQIILKDRILRFSTYNKIDLHFNPAFSIGKSNMKNQCINDLQMNNMSDRSYSTGEQIQNFLYITGIDYQLTSTQLKKIFSKYGELGLCYINTDRSTGQSKCTAVVEFKDVKIAESLLSQKNINIDTMTLIINPLIKKNKNNGRTIITRTKINIKSQDYLAGFAAGRSVGFREALTIKTQERI